MGNNATFVEMQALYPQYFKNFISKGIENEILDPRLKEFDLEKLGYALEAHRDMQFTFLSLQTLYDRYFIHKNEIHYELPQAFFMRVAMGLALKEENKEARAIEFYNLISSFDYLCSTPTLFNSGTVRSQLSSCFLTTIGDDLDSIFKAIKDNAMLSKWAGGLGNDWTPIRAMGAHIKGTNGKSLGIVPFLNVADATLIAVNQGGKRKGAGCDYLETWHLDIEEFLELRKNTGDERRRMKQKPRAERSRSSKKFQPKNYGEKCSACFLKQAIRGLLLKILAIYVHHNNTLELFTAPIYALKLL